MKNNRRRSWIQIALLFATPFLLALFQTYSIWDFFGDQADEQCLYYFAIGMFGGDFNPHWFGYGSLGMYLLYLVYVILAGPLLLIGKFSSMDEYAMQLFYNGYFVLTARYIFALLGLFMLYFYYKIGNSFKISRIYLLLFLFISILSVDTIYAANYIRSDYLVGFFVALALLFGIKSHNKKYLYFLSIAVAAAISSKISALPLVLFLFAYLGYHFYRKTIQWWEVLFIFLVFVASLIVFQPYLDYYQKILGILNVGSTGIQGNTQWGRPMFNSYSDRVYELVQIFAKNCSVPVLLSLFLLVFAKRVWRIILPSLFMLFLLIIPYYNSQELPDYWFLPAFNLVRFLAIIGVAEFINYLQRKSFSQNIKYFKEGLIVIVFIIAIVFVFKPQVSSYLNNFKWQESKKEIARHWIIENLAENNQILLEARSNYYIPQIYDPSNIKDSKKISRLFMYNRYKNQYLNDLFENYLKNYYTKITDISKIKGVQLIAFDGLDKNVMGKYYVTAEFNYRRFLELDPNNFKGEKRITLIDYQEYFKYMTSNPLVKRFDKGRGSTIDIYQIVNPLPDRYTSNKTENGDEKFYYEVNEQINTTNVGELTISFDLFLHQYPTTWTSIVSKLSGKDTYDFNFRIKNSKEGQWYFHTSKKAYVCKWIPEDNIELNKWVNVIITRSLKNRELKIYFNKKEIASLDFSEINIPNQSKFPINIMGDGENTIDGKLQNLKIWRRLLTERELEIVKSGTLDAKFGKDIVGFWTFEAYGEQIANDYSEKNVPAIRVSL